jgi:hypothetical protein
VDTLNRFVPPKNVLRFQISNLLKESIQFDFEKRIDQNHSLVISPNATWYGSSGDEATGAGLELALRKYSHLNISKSSRWTDGFFVSAKVGYNYTNLDHSTTENTFINGTQTNVTTTGNAKIQQFQLGTGIGFQFLFKKSISIDTSIGSRIKYNFKQDGDLGGSLRTQKLFDNGFSPFLRIGIGIMNTNKT